MPQMANLPWTNTYLMSFLILMMMMILLSFNKTTDQSKHILLANKMTNKTKNTWKW